MAVKGSYHHSMRIIAHRPAIRLLRYGIVLLVIAVSLPASYFAGGYFAHKAHEQDGAEVLGRQQQEVRDLSQELTKLRVDAEVNHQTIEELRQMTMTQKAQLSSTERDLRVYKELLSPGVKSNPLGISFGTFTVFPLKESGHYSYKLAIQKLSTKETNFSGNLEFRVVGQQAGKYLQLSLYQISSQVTSPSIPLSFKYFQTLEGDMQLPSDFTPQTVELVVKAGDRKAPPIVETQLEWPASS